MNINVSAHTEGFSAHTDPDAKYVWIDVECGDSKVGIFLTAERCDELIEAAATAKQLLLDAVADDPYNPGPYADQRRAAAEDEGK